MKKKVAELMEWYDRCLRGKFSHILAPILMKLLIQSFAAEFPGESDRANIITEFCRERDYIKITPPNNAANCYCF